MSDRKDLLILLHGFGARKRELGPLIETLSEDFEVLTPDVYKLLGDQHQHSNFSDQVDSLKAMLQVHLSGRSFHVVGISYGGALAWALAHEFGESCLSLHLINGMLPFPMNQIKPLALRLLLSRPNLIARIMGQVARLPLDKGIKLDLRILGFPRKVRFGARSMHFLLKVAAKFLAAIGNENWALWERRLLLLGPAIRLSVSEKDRLFNRKCYDDFVAHSQSAEIVFIPSAGHILSPTEMLSLAPSIKTHCVNHQRSRQRSA